MVDIVEEVMVVAPSQEGRALMYQIRRVGVAAV
jgi:hypothetical protein